MRNGRQWLAVALLVLIQFPLLSAAFAPTRDSKLPACCRRNGKHKCTTSMAGLSAHGGPTVEAAPCPSFPGSLPAATKQQPVLFAGAPQNFAVRSTSSEVRWCDNERPATSSCSSGDPRGPPAIQL